MKATKIHYHQENKAARFFYFLCKILYFSCGCNFWFEDLNIPTTFVKIYNLGTKIIQVLIFYFVISGWGALYTQKHLTEQQNNAIFMIGIPNTCLYIVYVSILYYRQELTELAFTLVVRLKRISNDVSIETMTIQSTSRYLAGGVFVVSFTVLTNGVYGAIQSITTNTTFTTIVPMWPDVEDRRIIAVLVRVFYYLLWWIFTAHVCSALIVILTITIYLSYQFKIVCKYFENLNCIFEDSGNQVDKESRYEDGFKLGIKMHCVTLRCVRQLQLVGNVLFSSQVIINILALFFAMLQMMYTERTLLAMMPIVFLAATALMLTGAFIWNAGDITIEASRLPTAMFFSGWHNCRGKSSLRVRKMVTIAMTQAQEPVLITCFGFIKLSYEFYVKIVKTSYTLFSVIY